MLIVIFPSIKIWKHVYKKREDSHIYFLLWQEADSAGKDGGDSYFTDLDYIECLSDIKEGYESNCTEPEQWSDCSDYSNIKENGNDCDKSEKRKLGQFEATITDSHESTTKSVRFFFGEDEGPYVVDGKDMGNVGRYFNVRLFCPN